MKKIAMAGMVVALLAGAALVRAQDVPKMPAPQKEHEWLKQLAGEWESEAEITPEPGKPPMKCKGTESARMFGGFFLVGEGKGDFAGMEFKSILTVGYDTDKKKYVGTWVDSMNGYLWKYEGTVDAAGKVLTLETEGPCHMSAGKLRKFKEVIEIKSKDEKTFSSSVKGDDGKWTTFVTVNYKRKK